YMFTTPTGQPLNLRTDHHEWKQLIARAGVAERRLHDAPHTAATVLLLPDDGGEGEQALGHADDDSGGGASAVAFQVELVFAGVIDRFDPLAHAGEVAVAAFFVFAVGSGEQHPDLVGGEAFQVRAG